MPQQLQHIVLLNFPEPVADDVDRRVRDAVASWDERIGLATECRIGSDISGRAGDWDYLLFTVFPSDEALRSYIAHPVHQEFVAFLDDHGVSRMAFDYWVDA